MSAGEAVIRKRMQAATDMDKHYVEYLRREDLADLIADLDAARLRAQMMPVTTLSEAQERALAVAAPLYAAAIDRLIDQPLPVRGHVAASAWQKPVPPTPLPEGYAALFVTFGSQYAREPHPVLPFAHPDGYWQVQYPVLDDPGSAWVRARGAVMAWSNGAFATSYDRLDDDLLAYVPWGEIALTVLP